jgi:hypothetical protein
VRFVEETTCVDQRFFSSPLHRDNVSYIYPYLTSTKPIINYQLREHGKAEDQEEWIMMNLRNLRDQEDDGKSILDEDHRDEGDPHHDKDLYLDKCEERSGIHEEPFKKVT